MLVERQAEVAALAAIVRGAAAGHGRFALALGAAGIGKTSLIEEAARLGQDAGALVLSARGTELEHGFGFGVVRQLFEPVLADAGRQRRTELLSGAAAPAAAVLGAAGPVPPAVGDFAVLHGLYWLMAAVCRERPVVMVIDDLHWADRASLRFLAYLLPRLDGMRLAAVAASRPHEPGAEQQLLQLLMIDRSCTVLRPDPLSEAGSAAMLDRLLGGAPSHGFLASCQAATGGNPLLLRELARVVIEEGLAATDDNLVRVPDLGAKAMAIRVGTRLARLPADCARLVRAVAVLGDGAPQHQAAALAELSPWAAAEAAEQLRRIDLIRVADTGFPAGAGPLLGFVHPMVRAAVYGDMHPGERVAGHAAAARLLAAAGAGREHVAKHLLRTPPAGDADTVEVLHRAGTDAAGRGAPDAALGYLSRCLIEPLTPALRLEVLTEIGPIAAQVDLAAAAGYLRQALGLVTGVAQRAGIAHQLARVLFYLDRAEEGDRVCTEAMGWLPEGATDLRRRMLAAVLNHAIWDPSYPGRAEVAAKVRALPPDDSLGAAMLDAVMAAHECLTGEPAGIALAERAIGSNVLVDLASADAGWLVGACETLLAADRDEAMSALEAGLDLARRRGSTTAVAMMLVFRGLGWLWRGQLDEAAADLREACHNADLVGLATAPFTGAFLPDVLVEQGRFDEASRVLANAEPNLLPPAGPWYFLLETKARLARAQGRYRDGLAAASAAGRYFGAFRFGNPAFCGWRSEAALCLHALGDTEEATWQAGEELRLARRWGAPRALGRALRVTGLVRGLPGGGLAPLFEAVEVLEKTPARLEHAKALVDLGAGLRRAGRRADAREHLARGIEIALRCGAGPVARRGETELRATGARPRRPFRTGPEGLTPSEHRVASLAADGLTNRDIAQQLFVTTKTIEVHLSSAYRKLGITRREQLVAALAATPKTV